jgi:uncharacterized protein (TIGR03437 family)
VRKALVERVRWGGLFLLGAVAGMGIAPAQTPPGAPTGVTATVGNEYATVSFTAPLSNGGAPITSYAVSASPGGISLGPPRTGATSPVGFYGLVNGTAYTFTVTATNSAGTGPASAPSAPVTPLPVVAPLDKPASLTVGPVAIGAYSPVTITPLENSTNFYFTAKNTGSQPVTLQFTSWDELRATKPSWLFLLFKLFGYEQVGQPTSIRLGTGETQTLVFYVSKDLGCGGSCNVEANLAGTRQQAVLPFRFRVVETGDQGVLPVTIVADDDAPDFFTVQSATITGRVTSADQTPIAGALVTVSGFNSAPVTASLAGNRTNSNRYQTRTGVDGRYSLSVISVDDLKTAMGARPFSYRSIDYYLTAEADGYSLTYRGGIAPATGQRLTADVTLQPLPQKISYTLVGELPTDGKLAYWWMRFAGNGDRIVSIQGQHDPPSYDPSHFLAADLSGKELWRVPTGAECWGLDVSPDGSLVAAGCYDKFVYILNSADGRVLRKLNLGDNPTDGRIVEVRFSPDGKSLVAGGGEGAGGFTVLDVQTGQVVWKSITSTVKGDEVQRDYKTRWSPDGQRVVVGMNGPMTMYTAAGSPLWRANIGESPLWLEVDDAYNVYAAGKSRQLFSYDKDGNLRWSYTLSHTSNEAWKGITADGSLVVIPSFDGTIQAFNAQGEVAWQHIMPTLPSLSPQLTAADRIFGSGHNALSMTPTGSLIAIGSRGYEVLLYDRNGSLLWRHRPSIEPLPQPPNGAFRPGFQGEDPDIHGNYTGTTSIAISPDGKYIAAGYADSVIRIFRRDDTLPGAPTISSVNAAGGGPDIAQNTWIEIKGTGLAPPVLGANGSVWSTAPEFVSGKMPTQWQGVSVTVNDNPAYVYFVSPTQVNVLTPLDSTEGPVTVQVTNGGVASAKFTVNLKSAAPAFFRLGATNYIAGQHADFSLIGPASMSVPGYPFTPAKPGETVVLYGSGFGLPTASLLGGSATQSGALPNLPVVRIGGTAATVVFAGLAGPGLYQINVVVPATAADGDNAITASYGGASTPAGPVITVQH